MSENMDIYNALAKSILRQSQNQQLRRIEFVEKYITDPNNMRESGLYKIQVQQMEQLQGPTQYIFDPMTLNQILCDTKKSISSGLINNSNACYANAMIQCIVASSSLSSLFQSNYYQIMMKGDQVANALFKTIHSMQLGQKNNNFLQVLPIFHMNQKRQSDASELLLKFLDHVIEYEVKIQNMEKDFLNKETTAIDQIIGQTHVQVLTCKTCCAVKQQPTQYRTCIIPLEKSLRRSFQQFLSDVEIQDYTCGACGQKVTITKQVQITKVSRVVLVQLQRWNDLGEKNYRCCRVPEFVNFTHGITKSSIVEIDEPGGDLFSRVAKHVGTHTHRLRAVICHQGTPSCGHYYVYAFSGSWKKYDDESVKVVQSDEVIEGRDALFLLYEAVERVQNMFLKVPTVQKEDKNAQDRSLRIQPVQNNTGENAEKKLQKHLEDSFEEAEVNDLNIKQAETDSWNGQQPHFEGDIKDVQQFKEEIKRDTQPNIQVKFDPGVVLSTFKSLEKQQNLGQKQEQKERKSKSDQMQSNPFTRPQSAQNKQVSQQMAQHLQPGGFLSDKSDILHSNKSEMDLDIDRARTRKNQKTRDENRRQRSLEIEQRRQEKTQRWKDRQDQIRMDRDRIQRKMGKK